ncbi:McrB family protein [[Clostridium] aminophilum]|uniref:McrB family protein n=1 Tax=[Clostridium] aminophilum TaxID=1526 RepID=UPI003F992116
MGKFSQVTKDAIAEKLIDIKNRLDINIPTEEQSSNIVIENELLNEDFTFEELVEKLNEMYDNPNCKNKAAAIHMFAIKYGYAIKKNNISATSLADAANVSSNYHAEITKGIHIYESILNNEYGVCFYMKEHIKNCLEKERSPREIKIHPLNSIIYGAPGTGKTYSTAEYAQAIIEGVSLTDFRASNPERKEVMKRYNDLVRAGQIVFTTFHQSYGYEEFIQGLRPDTTSDKMNFKTVDGVFKRIADRALNDDENNYVIIIDEINRANISKVFGELITLIEDDKRWGELNQTSATLQSGDPFAVPNNLYIVGTMNSADKSISLIDAALRRRFEFIEQKPDASLVTDPTMQNILIKLNSMLADQLDSADLLIGHSYFMNKTVDDLPKVLNNSIIPLLYEYFYDNKKKVMGVLNSAVEQVDYVIEDDKLGRIYVERQTRN